MANYDQLNQELETLKSKFMLLDTDEERKAFRSEVTAFIDSKSDEEKQLVNEAFIAGANDACARADKLIDNVLRNKLDGIYESISWSYIARTYFNKSRAWLSQRINGLMIHGKEVQFTYEEKQTLLQALRDIGKKNRTYGSSYRANTLKILTNLQRAETRPTSWFAGFSH